NDLNHKIGSYGKMIRTSLGTTVLAVLVVGQTYYILNVGDTRAYLLADQLYQLTHDQTFIQMQIDQGLMTLQQAENDPRRSVLLQCVGASPSVKPDFFTGTLQPGQRLLLCSDGFRHVISPAEIYAALAAHAAPDRQRMTAGLQQLVELNKARMETDNITVLLIHV
ncbi:MAG: serine/threonine-protein phosphatase, partial [Oscillospiraceae bacterium]|nr:serine/threonine-protein phosphatase [Oscillospiraceae bacterium]